MIFNKLLKEPEEVLNNVILSIERNQSFLLTYFNQHCFNIYCKNEVYKKVIDSYFDAYQADLGVFLALKFLEKEKISRIDATEMNQVIMNELIKKKHTLVIVGGNFDEEFIRKEAIKRGINFVGYHSGYFNESQTSDVIEYLKKFNAQVYILAMGVPLQEIFAERLSQSLNSKTIICVGNIFEFYFGTKKRAPVFIQKIGFEWMFRMLTEPQRLWKRYLIGIPLFIYRIIKIKLARTD